MPASDKFTPIKHRMKGRGFPVLNKCPYCKDFHATIEDTPLAPWLHHNHQACQNCKHNRSKTEQGEGYILTGRKKAKAVNA